MVTELDRWVKLASKAWPFRKTLEEFMELHAGECECATMLLGPSFEIVSLNVPREVLALAKKREKNGQRVDFKVQSQMRLNASEMTQRLRVLFCWIQEDLDGLNIAGKGTVDVKHIERIQFFYKHFLRVANHWNFCHPNVGGGLSGPMLRNLMQTLGDKHNGALLGVVLNELDFLRAYLGFEGA